MSELECSNPVGSNQCFNITAAIDRCGGYTDGTGMWTCDLHGEQIPNFDYAVERTYAYGSNEYTTAACDVSVVTWSNTTQPLQLVQGIVVPNTFKNMMMCATMFGCGQ